MEDLDKTMTALEKANIDQSLLVSLAAVKQIQSALNLPLGTVRTFWADLDTDGEDSLYLSLFQNPAVLYPPDPAFQLIYSARLQSAPMLELPSPMFPNLVYDPVAQTLTLTTGLGAAELAQLQTVSNNDPALMAAIQILGELLFLIAFGVNVPFLAPLAALPPGRVASLAQLRPVAISPQYHRCDDRRRAPAAQFQQ